MVEIQKILEEDIIGNKFKNTIDTDYNPNCIAEWNWGAKGVGFGQIVGYRMPEGRMFYDSEKMSLNFIQSFLKRRCLMDNFQIIASILRQKDMTEDNFFFLQILKRKKDNPEMDVHVMNLDNFFLKNVEDLFRKEARIKELCDKNNARAYIRLNKRSKKQVALQTLKLIAENVASENYEIKNCHLSVCGQFHADENKSWVVDVDGDIDNSYLDGVYLVIDRLIRETGRTPSVHTVPTKNGRHIITQPFNLKLFKDIYSIDVHKDNPTLLYCP
jgi:hypothetical protein